MVSFVSYRHGDKVMFDGKGCLLAHAFYPYNNEGLSVDIHFDDEEEFTLGTASWRNILWVTVHNVGHALGMNHSNERDAIMHPRYPSEYNGDDFDLTEDDIAGIQSIYGKKVPPIPVTKNPPTAKTTMTPGNTTNYHGPFYVKNSGETYVVDDTRFTFLVKNLAVKKRLVELDSLFFRFDSLCEGQQQIKGNVLWGDWSFKMFWLIDFKIHNSPAVTAKISYVTLLTMALEITPNLVRLEI